MHGPACETLRTRQVFYELVKRRRRDLYEEYVRGAITRENIFLKFEDIREAVFHRVIQETLSEDSIQSVIGKIRDSMNFHKAKKIDVFLGGPPCQPYSIINRARILKNGDSLGRNYLYEHYLRLMREFQPDVFIYENVPGLFSVRDKGQKIFEKLLDDFRDLNPAYEIIPPLHLVSKDPHSYILNSADFGVPQTRKRLILIGYRQDLEQKNEKIRGVFEKLIQARKNPDEYLTVKDAISDLPHVKPGKGDDRFFGQYPERSKITNYQKKLRVSSLGILNHRARTHMPSDLDRYRFFIQYWRDNKKPATLRDLIRQRPAISPDHENLDEYIDRFKVQWWKKPASTITAHISKDGHYFIHPDIRQCRSFTVREAARCQSFPDNFFFEGPRTDQFRQVGNAVPPMLARAIGMAIRDELKNIRS
ncbi:MAG: DNA cytosine methyltransferase [Deltaproteobacteria bacterium]|nr:DNA cytosine methyltransferase [Deltaproteobacteria bacterium]